MVPIWPSLISWSKLMPLIGPSKASTSPPSENKLWPSVMLCLIIVPCSSAIIKACDLASINATPLFVTQVIFAR